jgi:hypothetical protein
MASLVHYIDTGIASTGSGADRQVKIQGGTFKEIVNAGMSLVLLLLLALIVVGGRSDARAASRRTAVDE